jgi:ABC superfamily ATP binding cassette transporter, ABC/membrane protein
VLVGKSGSGKTTTAQVLMGLVPPTSGQVNLLSDGASLDLREVELNSWWRQLTWVSQHPAILPGSVRQYLLSAGACSQAELEKAAQVTGFDAVVAALPQGWDTQLGQGGVGLSVGQRQRLALTRALVNPSALVLLDEPSAHLDAISENQIVQAVLQLRAAGSTVVVIAHRQALINIADNVIEVCAQALAAQEA